MWLRGERCGRAPDDEGMRMRGGEETGGWGCRGGGGGRRCVACARHVCQFLATEDVPCYSLKAALSGDKA